MKPIRFKKFLKNKELNRLLNQIVAVGKGQVEVQDAKGQVVFGEEISIESSDLLTIPIVANHMRVGVVRGDQVASVVHGMIEYALGQHFFNREIANETLERYKELTLLYQLGENLSEYVSPQEIADYVVKEILSHLPGDSASVYLFNSEFNHLELASASGVEYNQPHLTFQPGQGIAGTIYISANGELINNLSEDKRYVNGQEDPKSMMCVPLKLNEKVLGVINISSTTDYNYQSNELKLLTAMAIPCAFAIENALIYEKKLEEDRIKNQLERYVPSQLVDAIIEDAGQLDFEPKTSNIAVLFSDIRNFTTRCENLPAPQIVDYLNTYFSEMVEIIFRHNGTINKFVGDMIVALFGAPHQSQDNEKNAIQAAIEMQQKLKLFPDNWIRENFETGIGISAGEVVVGNIGSPKHMDYTAIGDEVNIASRLQGLAQGGEILTTHQVMEVLNKDFNFTSIGEKVQVKGRSQSVDVYQVQI